MILLLWKYPPFPEINIEKDGFTFIPVPDVLIALYDTRHFMVSKKHPEGNAIISKLNRGLAVLMEQGIVDSLYRDCGFYRSDLDGWTILNANMQ